MVFRISSDNISLNQTFHDEVLGESKIAMVYGFFDCGYTSLSEFLTKNKHVEQSLDYNIGAYDPGGYPASDGRIIEQLPYSCDRRDFTKTYCKMGITNLLLENVKRENGNLPLIPLLFTVDIENNQFPATAKSITSRSLDTNSLITYSELRRCYKLANTFESKKVREVANKTFKFLKLETDEEGKLCPLQVPPLWESEPEFHKLMLTREVKSNNSRGAREKTLYWRDVLRDKMEVLDLMDKDGHDGQDCTFTR